MPHHHQDHHPNTTPQEHHWSFRQLSTTDHILCKLAEAAPTAGRHSSNPKEINWSVRGLRGTAKACVFAPENAAFAQIQKEKVKQIITYRLITLLSLYSSLLYTSLYISLLSIPSISLTFFKAHKVASKVEPQNVCGDLQSASVRSVKSVSSKDLGR